MDAYLDQNRKTDKGKMMASTAKISEEALRVVREQLAYFLRFLGLEPSNANRLTVGESFPVFLIPADHIPRSAVDSERMSLFAEDTGTWHHQLRIDNSAVAYARSGPAEKQGQWVIIRVLKSTLAAGIDQAIDILDREKTDNDISVVLVSAPAFRLHAFLLTHPPDGRHEILVIQSPFNELEKNRLYGEQEFMKLLLQMQPIVGIETD